MRASLNLLTSPHSKAPLHEADFRPADGYNVIRSSVRRDASSAG